jgi:hypothetical protein
MRACESFHATTNLSKKIKIVLFTGRKEYDITEILTAMCANNKKKDEDKQKLGT